MSRPDSQNENIPKELLEKMKVFCAYQERCVNETKRKIKSLGGDQPQTEQLIAWLQHEGYLSDTRFAKVFAHGKFSHNHWGRIKISLELEKRNIERAIIVEALQEIDETSYEKKLKKLISQKANDLKARNATNPSEKIAAYCLQKGYEPDLFWSLIHENLNS